VIVADSKDRPERTPKIVSPRRVELLPVVSGALALLLVAIVVYAAARAPAMDWPAVRHYLFSSTVRGGVKNTVLLTLLCEALAIGSGAVTAATLLGSNAVGRTIAHAYQWVFRSVPELAQLLFWFNLALVFPRLKIGIPFGGPSFWSADTNTVMTPWTAAVLGIGLHEGAYLAEVFRSGVRSVDRVQTDAARALGLSRRRVAIDIIWPQAMRVIAPNAGSRLIGTLKLTALASILAVPELLYSVQSIYSRTFETVPLLVVASAWYMAMVGVLRLLQHWLERRYELREGLVTEVVSAEGLA
jgi:polar amino acid transport system permease protein